MSTATTTSHDTGQHTTSRTTTQPTNSPVTQTNPNAAQRLRTTMAAVKLAFTWLGVRKTLAPEQRTTAARAFHADRDLLSASKLILDTKNAAYRNVARVRSEASGYWRAETLPFPEAGLRLLPQAKLPAFDSRMAQYRQELQSAASELAGQYDQIKSEAERRLGTLFNASDYPTTLDGLFDLEVSYPTIEPPAYLVSLHPGVYQAEQARVRERFESAVELAEQAFAGELQKLVSHLSERLTGLHDGQPKAFRGRLHRQRKSGSTHPKTGQQSAHLNYPATLNSFRSCLKVIDTFRYGGGDDGSVPRQQRFRLPTARPAPHRRGVGGM